MNPEIEQLRIALLDISDMLNALHQMLVADHHEIIKLRTRIEALENPPALEVDPHGPDYISPVVS